MEKRNIQMGTLPNPDGSLLTQNDLPSTASNIDSNPVFDVAVIGGGPAGMMAAGRAAERGQKVILLEKNVTLGRKLLMTGGGRCNLTNAEMNTRIFLSKFADSGKFLHSALSQHGVKETLDFFHSHDMPTKEEANKRVFPLSNSSTTVLETLLKYLESGNVQFRTNAEVTGFLSDMQENISPIDGTNSIHEMTSDTVDNRSKIPSRNSKTIRGIELKNGEIIHAKSYVVATGGKSHPETGSTGQGFVWLGKLGHNIIAPSASLVPVTVSDSWVKTLAGVSMPNAKLTIFQDGKKISGKRSMIRGKILFTHFGLSGPAILNASSIVNECMKYGEVILSLDLLPDHDYSTLNSALQKLFSEESNKKFKNAISKLVPAAFTSVIIERSGIDPEIQCNSVTREERLSLVKFLKDIHIHPTGLLGTDKAIVTSGGVTLAEVDFRTMQSRLIPNLFLVGDVLDIDRPSGGFSLQLCWTTGWVAGNSVANN